MHKSNLIIHPDVKTLQEIAKEHAGKFNLADVFWLKSKAPDPGGSTFKKGESIKVEETLEFIERAHLAPVGERKLFIICDAATMTVPAQNKMLKTIEDAPASTTFLLLATSVEPLLNTIRSRCVTKFMPVPPGTNPLIPTETAETLKKLFNVEINEQSLSNEQRYKLMATLAKINRNIAANCNAQNQTDALLIDILEFSAPKKPN